VVSVPCKKALLCFGSGFTVLEIEKQLPPSWECTKTVRREPALAPDVYFGPTGLLSRYSLQAHTGRTQGALNCNQAGHTILNKAALQ
jgi:hypothetical protein